MKKRDLKERMKQREKIKKLKKNKNEIKMFGNEYKFFQKHMG